MEKYRLNYNNITKHEVISETAKFITYKKTTGYTDREAKSSNYANWFDTKEDAINFRIEQLKERVNLAELRLKIAKEELEGFKIDNPL